MTTWRLGHRPALDGLRAIAVVLVLLAHSRIPLVGNGGGVGVAIFFTLSGFLITALLLQEREDYGAFRIRAFYRRRLLRLVPAMVVCVALAIAVGLYLYSEVLDWALIAGTLTYTANWVMAAGAYPPETGLGHTWSLAIEEQFYLVWPLVLVATASLSRSTIVRGLVAICGVILMVRGFLWDGGDGLERIYFGSDTRADGLLFGAAVAFILHKSPVRSFPNWAPWAALTFLGTCCLIPDPLKTIAMPTAVGIATAVSIYLLVQRPGFALLEMKWARWIGRRSYGIYLYQSPLHVLVLVKLGESPLWWFLVHIPLTLLAAWASYRWIETPFLRLKDRDPRSRAHLEATER